MPRSVSTSRLAPYLWRKYAGTDQSHVAHLKEPRRSWRSGRRIARRGRATASRSLDVVAGAAARPGGPVRATTDGPRDGGPASTSLTTVLTTVTATLSGHWRTSKDGFASSALGFLWRGERPFKAEIRGSNPLGCTTPTRYKGGDFGRAPPANDNSFDNSSQIISDNSSSLYADESPVSPQGPVDASAGSENRRRRAW
jgi:hypothetical protein